MSIEKARIVPPPTRRSLKTCNNQGFLYALFENGNPNPEKSQGKIHV